LRPNGSRFEMLAGICLGATWSAARLILSSWEYRELSASEWARNDGGAVCQVQAGKVTKIGAYRDRDRGVADLGLEE
jgi:hypothetical protein